tara:strand:- start:1628 stop:2704 length:1077 start_codon:yes stop_codon:yes gene_type:complete
MKVAIGSQVFDGSWGGGNLFVKNLKYYLLENNTEVVHYLDEPDIDIILITEPRIESLTSTISLFEARLYKSLVNKNVKLIHRINECDERKNTNYVNKKMIKVSQFSDSTIFVSSWISDLYKNQGIKSNKSRVILSGSDTEVFNNINKKPWDKTTKLKIVTHHWGNNWNKGFEIYSFIDNLLEESNFSDKFEFAFIGNLPVNFNFKNTNYIEPKSGLQLADELKRHDLYITGSLNEPSGNHQIEGSLCGLPVLYINSGGIPEYQKNYGVEFNKNNLETKLLEIFKNYDYYFEKNKSFNFKSNVMCKEYFDVIKSIYQPAENRKNKIYFSLYKLVCSKKLVSLLRYVVSKLIYQMRKVSK